MMRLLHTADWHLGKKLEHVTRIDEQRAVMAEICALADKHKVDAVLVAGDIFDKKNPDHEAETLYYRTIKRLTDHGRRPVVVIAGNHDSPDRLLTSDPLARELGIFILGYPDTKLPPVSLESGVELVRTDAGFVELRLPNCAFPLRLIATPYANEYRLRRQLNPDDKAAGLREVLQQHWQRLADAYCDEAGANVLMTHLFVQARGTDLEAEPEGEKPIAVGGASVVYTDLIPPQIQYTALGHLHRHHKLGGHSAPVVYASSPLAYSFAEADQVKKAVLVEVEPSRVADYTPLELGSGKKLLRHTAKTVDEAVEWLSENQTAWVEVKMNTPTFLTGEDTRRLKAAHAGLIGILPPDLNNTNNDGEAAAGHTIDLRQPVEQLFRQYFEHKHGQPPSDSLTALFDEVRGD